MRQPRPLPRSFIAQAVIGFTYPLEALTFISKHRLWGMTMVPFIVNLVLFLLLLTAVWLLGVPVVEAANAWLAGIAGSSGFVRGLFEVLSWLIWVLALALTVGLSGIVILLFGQAFASPFLDALSEKVENLAVGSQKKPMSLHRLIATVVLAIGDLIWGLVFLALIHVPILIVGMTGLGAVPAAAASFCFSAWLLSQEFVGLALTRQLVGYRGRWRAVWANKWVTLGFGSACMLLLLVPVLNLVLLPLAAVGGTLLYCDLAAAGRLEGRESSPAALAAL